jgi:hypothetical protein
VRISLLCLTAVTACAGAQGGAGVPGPDATEARPAPEIRPDAQAADSQPATGPKAGERPTPAPRSDTASAPDGPSADPLGREAAAVVDRQNEAYNRHDLEAFLAADADSVVVQRLGDTVVMAGKASLRESTSAWFAEAPSARTEVVQRMVLGPYVVDRQRVSGAPATPPLEAIGIYEVRGGLIRRVWSMPPPPTPH